MPDTREVDWNDLLTVLLHDPPDKALDIPRHENRACRYLSEALGRRVTKEEVYGQRWRSDVVASIAERLPVPRPEDERRRVGPEDDPSGRGCITVFHPLIGGTRSLDGTRLLGVRREGLEKGVRGAISKLCGSVHDARMRFFLAWRLLPLHLARIHPDLPLLPAETRAPDHTIWHHNDITAGLHAAAGLQQSTVNAAFLAFSIGPVQPFIAAARSVRDLWTGSFILARTVFRAMLPVVRTLGPTALVFPALRGLPLLDLWMADELGIDAEDLSPSTQARKAPCIPNRFLAIVPCGEDGIVARQFARECERAAREAWRELADRVRGEIGGTLRSIMESLGADSGVSSGEDWDRLWDCQIDSFFDVRTAVLPIWESTENIRRSLLGEDALMRTAALHDLEGLIPDDESYRRRAHRNPEEEEEPPRETIRTPWGQWQDLVGLAGRLLDAERQRRHVPATSLPDGPVPAKCSLMGSYEQMGPAHFAASADFWGRAHAELSVKGVRLRSRERLCAVSLVKRFAGPVWLAGELGLDAGALRFPDTATVAAAEWLKEDPPLDLDELRGRLDREDGRSWSGQWLHWPHPNLDEEEDPVPDWLFDEIQEKRRPENTGAPPAYYAVLHLDGDDMGRWLRGEKTPHLGDVYHPKLRDYFLAIPGEQDRAREILEKKQRPVGPALHAAISSALSAYALRVVPHIVERFHGTLIYAGGDDVLALLPARAALCCALALRSAFRGDPRDNGGASSGYYRCAGGSDGEQDLLMMGPRATVSCGIAVVHYKEDLRDALDAARGAERQAKDHGRDALVLACHRRSGEHSQAFVPWQFVPTLTGWIDAFAKGATDRWAYRLRQEEHILGGLPPEAARGEIHRLLKRSDDVTKRLFHTDGPNLSRSPDTTELEGDRESVVDPAAALDQYRSLVEEANERRRAGVLDEKGMLRHFITLCQSASFLARGREGR